MAFCAPLIPPVSLPSAPRSSLPPGGQIGVARDMQLRESFWGHDHPAVAELNVHGIIRRGRDQFGLRGPAILRELLRVPAARNDQPCARRHAVRRLANAIQSFASERVPIQFTSVLKLSAARMACMWESIKPGMTVRPWRSMTRACAPAILRISDEVPTATILPPLTSSASTVENCESAVRILPLSKIVCANDAPAANRAMNSRRGGMGSTEELYKATLSVS